MISARRDLVFVDKLSISRNIDMNVRSEISRKDAIIEEQRKAIESLQDELMNQSRKIERLEVELTSQTAHGYESSESQKTQSRYWSPEEHQRFLEAVSKFGMKDVKSIANYVGTRNTTQVRTHGQKYFLRLERERKRLEEEKMEALSGDSPAEKKKRQKRRRSTSMDIPLSALNGSSNLNPSPSPLPPPKAIKQEKKQLSEEELAIQASLVPQFIQQQIASETRDSVLNTLKGWTISDYNAFIEGLVFYSEEKDINMRCQLISQNYLHGYTAEEIKNCFIVLSNVARSKDHTATSEDGVFLSAADVSKLVIKPNAFPFFSQHKLLGHEKGVLPTMAARPTFGIQQLRYPHTNRPFQPHSSSLDRRQSSDSFQRRASFPMDPFDRKPPISREDLPSTPGEQETLFPEQQVPSWTSSDSIIGSKDAKE